MRMLFLVCGVMRYLRSKNDPWCAGGLSSVFKWERAAALPLLRCVCVCERAKNAICISAPTMLSGRCCLFPSKSIERVSSCKFIHHLVGYARDGISDRCPGACFFQQTPRTRVPMGVLNKSPLDTLTADGWEGTQISDVCAQRWCRQLRAEQTRL